MMSYRKWMLLTVLTAVMFYMVPQQEAEAFEPISMIVLAPVAMQAAKVLAPYAVKMASNLAKVLLRVGIHVFETVLLPIGLIESTILAPWFFRHGVKHMWVGICGPFKACGWTLLLPLSPFGVGVNGALSY